MLGSAGTSFQVALLWEPLEGLVPIPPSPGEQVRVKDSGTRNWRKSSVTAAAPAQAAYVRLAAFLNGATNSIIHVDDFAWHYQSPNLALMYRAVQPATGYSDTTEPAWPGQLGEQVIDNEVIWEAISIARVVYEARPLLRSGATEPAWPTADGDRVLDGTISWEATSSRVQDPNCPNSKVVAIAASKVFAADGDIIRFSATVNPTDWTSENNAGYLASGLQQANSNDMTVLNQYRGDLVAFNPNCFQNWQVDPDPELMALLDQMDGIGSSWQQAAQPVANDLIYLSQLGVRSVGRAAGTESLAAGDIGMPVDPLVQEAIAAALAVGIEPVSTYYPSAGQYWLAFPGYPVAGETLCFVVSLTGGSPKWSRYLFPFAIESFAQLGDDLYIRNGDQISIVSESVATDDVLENGDPPSVEAVPFPGVVWWPWLDMGRPGVTKMMEGVDVVGSGSPSLSIGYDQRNITAFTAPYAIPADTVPGGIIPFPVSAPSISVRLDFAGGQKWSLQAVGLVLADTGGGP